MAWDQLTQEQQETVKGMVEYCLDRGIGMGMDEGFACLETYTPNEEREALESFCKDN